MTIKSLFLSLMCCILLTGCIFAQFTPTPLPPTATFPVTTSEQGLPTAKFTVPTSEQRLPTPTLTIAPTEEDWSLTHYPSKAKFQVFILNPVRTCLAGNDFASGDVCFGKKCGDCNCRWEDFDPQAPMLGIPPDRIDDPQYQGYAYRQCLAISLSEKEVNEIKKDMLKVAEEVYEWSEGALELQMTFTEIPHDYAGFVAPDFVFGPFEVDDELLNLYVGTDTDFVYVITGVNDYDQQKHLSYACGGSYGEMSIHGAGYANIQYNNVCNSVYIGGEKIYEPLIHEWYHNLDWALYHINQVPDKYDGLGPDWGNWKHGAWPACDTGGDPLGWFPSVDLCEWDPDWIDCNNDYSAGKCIHAGENTYNQMSWYEHVIRAHYPKTLQFIGNHCRDGRQDISETGVDSGWPCP